MHSCTLQQHPTPQVKTWTPDGTPITTSNHHNKQVECLLVTPLHSGAAASSRTSSGGGGGGGKLWTGAADGTLWVWADEVGGGQMDSSKGRVVRVEGGKCEWLGVWEGGVGVHAQCLHACVF